MNESERKILMGVDIRYKYLARDKNNKMFLFETKPKKKVAEGIWDLQMDNRDSVKDFSMFSHLFNDIRWEDVEPLKIIREHSNEKEQEREI